MTDKLTETIASTKDLSVGQDQSVIAQYGLRKGVIVVEFSVDEEMAKLGVDALPTGTYYKKIADCREPEDGGGSPNVKRNVCLPDNAILLGTPIVDVHKAKAGSGTITPAVGSVTLAAVSSTGVSVDDGAGDVLIRGRKNSADEAISFAVASATVTAGAFTVILEYVQGTNS